MPLFLRSFLPFQDPSRLFSQALNSQRSSLLCLTMAASRTDVLLTVAFVCVCVCMYSAQCCTLIFDSICHFGGPQTALGFANSLEAPSILLEVIILAFTICCRERIQIMVSQGKVCNRARSRKAIHTDLLVVFSQGIVAIAHYSWQ